MAGFRKKHNQGPGPSGGRHGAAGQQQPPYGGPPQPPQGGYGHGYGGGHGYGPPGPGYRPGYGQPGPGGYGGPPGPGHPGGYGGPGGPAQSGPPHGGYPVAPGGPGPDSPDAHGPKLRWQALLRGVVLRPSPTFWRMRDYPVWGPAIIVSFLYGLVAVFGLDDARQTILDTTASNVAPYLLVTGVAMVFGALVLSSVTHVLARQFGGNGHWAPTAGLAMLIMTLTDVPRLALAIFLGGGQPLVQIVGWLTWLYAGALFTMMIVRSHEIPWPRALAASGIQLLGLLMLVKLGTL